MDDLRMAAFRTKRDWFQTIWKYRQDGMALIKHAEFPEVTISACIEIGQSEGEIAVPLQRIYTGKKPIIPSSLANIPCTTLGLHGLLERLNATLCTSYTLDNPSLASLLEACIVKKYDFGTAYGSLRTAWYTESWSQIPYRLRECEEKDREMRQTALHGGRIVEPWIYPRRVWDLYSNRVVPIWITGTDYPAPISHAWVDEYERNDEWTPINGRDWPVPIPKDTNLERIRVEMLNMDLEYVWLDVLCLRQRGGAKEDIRAEEWMLDVPTIGFVYFTVDVYCYLSGLGRPLSVEQGYFDSDRCWFNRAWTLQEIGLRNRKICGNTPDGPMNAKKDERGNYETDLLSIFHRRLQNMRKATHRIFDMLEEMRHRASTNPVDKIAGMAFLLGSPTIPAYYESHSIEDAWTALMNTTDDTMRGAVFFLYPEPGNAGAKWRPSWDQLMTKPLPRDYLPLDDYYFTHVERDWKENVDRCEALCIEKALLRGLDVEGILGTDRCGELLVEDEHGVQHAFNVIATHPYLIASDIYTLIGSGESFYSLSCQWVQWVVGRRLSDGSFEKISVLKMADDVDRSTLAYLAGEKRVCILV
ncbi:hypothetical protein EDD18DRAFT_505505 [Armillaria luteobubalina]|uniref:Heterokaryon incompatibility domain-containing protein n=1 Tax=Armillaria luteobubalina TaxID=153913 RepID=A0AA39TZG1_9AGAR|nr:hypothetical protein EDD18DRAFT_505505 [Armillaria luteobubalina]